MKTTARRYRDLAERLECNSVPDHAGCWLWLGAHDRKGYGRLTVRERGKKTPVGKWAHRVAYELLVGPIGEGLQLDHLCRNPACINPAHLEPVTLRENVMRQAAARSAY